MESFFKKPESNVQVGIGRAGNVIGGGDWAPHRIIPDCIKSGQKMRGLKLEILLLLVRGNMF